ncbi:hypothetical protein MRB53_034358 [Persea americana]|uniref:Uncharacterized protein n=1 Tax=Persea americana TaxID=3435 RepID=A0ACC2KYH1_PERAE|nr:hypothetical protein MRB53_034358 [Persea americana]
MDERNDVDKGDEVMLPGFRFHPTDEELVGFYLKRKIQQRPLSIELIRQLDIYKYDPWDLPKELATTGEKEWYFYCPRDRKYRNSTRPNRVTGAGFWKATGTDRPIYSSDGTKCIGLKKSLVFYKGRAAKGIKTDWMMHEFRLPSSTDSTMNKRPLDKNIPANDSWAICRIFKKTNSMAQRALSHSWVSPFPADSTSSDIFSHSAHNTKLTSDNISCTTETLSTIQFCCNNLSQSATNFSLLDVPFYKPINSTVSKPPLPPILNAETSSGFMFPTVDMSMPTKCTADVTSMLLNMPPSILGDAGKASVSVDSGLQQQCNIFTISIPPELHENVDSSVEEPSMRKNTNVDHDSNQWGATRTVGFPFSLPTSLTDAWKLNMPWDSPAPCPSEMSSSFSTNKCYTQ